MSARSSSFVRSAIFSAFVLAGIAASPVAHAQDHSAADLAQARELFNQGIDLREKGDTLAALEKLRAAHALVSSPITGLELGRTNQLLGRLLDARESFLTVARLPISREETPRSAAARAECAKLAEDLRPRIPSLTIKVTGAPAQAVAVVVDGAAIPTEALATPRFLNPGSHHIVATSTQGGSRELTLELKEGEAREAELALPGPPVPGNAADAAGAPGPGDRAAAAPTAIGADLASGRHGWSTQKTLAIAAAGVGVAGAVAGLAFALEAKSSNSDSESQCNPRDVTQCTARGVSLRGDAHTQADLGTAGAVVAVLGLAGGAVLWFTSPREPPGPTGSARPRVTRVVAGVRGAALEGEW
jgi:hypothetical protein